MHNLCIDAQELWIYEQVGILVDAYRFVLIDV